MRKRETYTFLQDMDFGSQLSWEELRRDARSIERKLEAAIQRYASTDIESQNTLQETEKVHLMKRKIIYKLSLTGRRRN